MRRASVCISHERYPLDEARQWIGIQKELADQVIAYEFAIHDEADCFLGGCGINQISKANRFANLGYRVRTSAMGRGVAPAAARLVAEYAFRETDLNPTRDCVCGGVQPGEAQMNRPSSNSFHLR